MLGVRVGVSVRVEVAVNARVEIRDGVSAPLHAVVYCVGLSVYNRYRV